MSENIISPPIGTVLVDDEDFSTVALDDAAEDTGVAEEAAPVTNAVIYMGPSIDRVIVHGTIYQDGVIPSIVEEKAKEIPAIRALIVPFDQCAQVARAVTLPDGRYRMLYDMVQGTAITR